MKEEIRELLEQAKRSLAHSRKLAHNSYGAGYDQGQVDAYEQVLNIMTEYEKK